MPRILRVCQRVHISRCVRCLGNFWSIFKALLTIWRFIFYYTFFMFTGSRWAGPDVKSLYSGCCRRETRASSNFKNIKENIVLNSPSPGLLYRCAPTPMPPKPLRKLLLVLALKRFASKFCNMLCISFYICKIYTLIIFTDRTTLSKQKQPLHSLIYFSFKSLIIKNIS